MPLWIIYHPPTTFQEEDVKQALAKEITSIYTSVSLPAFYVNVFFIPVAASSYFIGGVSRPSPQKKENDPGPNSETPWIRVYALPLSTFSIPHPFLLPPILPLMLFQLTNPFIVFRTIQHIARSIPNATVRDKFLARVDQVLKPFIADKGYDWEYSVEETSRDFWKMNGLVPPMPSSEAEKEWVKENRAVPFERAKGGLEKL